MQWDKLQGKWQSEPDKVVTAKLNTKCMVGEERHVRDWDEAGDAESLCFGAPASRMGVPCPCYAFHPHLKGFILP